MKNKLNLLAILVIVLTSFGCQKENNSPNSNNYVPPKGHIYFKNNHADTYKVYVDGYHRMTLTGGTTSAAYEVTPNAVYSIKATQITGYIFIPAVFEGTATTTPGGYITWAF